MHPHNPHKIEAISGSAIIPALAQRVKNPDCVQIREPQVSFVLSSETTSTHRDLLGKRARGSHVKQIVPNVSSKSKQDYRPQQNFPTITEQIMSFLLLSNE